MEEEKRFFATEAHDDSGYQLIYKLYFDNELILKGIVDGVFNSSEHYTIEELNRRLIACKKNKEARNLFVYFLHKIEKSNFW